MCAAWPLRDGGLGSRWKAEPPFLGVAGRGSGGSGLTSSQSGTTNPGSWVGRFLGSDYSSRPVPCATDEGEGRSAICRHRGEPLSVPSHLMLSAVWRKWVLFSPFLQRSGLQLRQPSHLPRLLIDLGISTTVAAVCF